jgi:diguanylate cyclase (GGDEF)-like protein
MTSQVRFILKLVLYFLASVLLALAIFRRFSALAPEPQTDMPSAWLDAEILIMEITGLVLLASIFVLHIRWLMEEHKGLESRHRELQHIERMLRIRSHYDGLTGLANRRLLADRFQQSVHRAKRSRSSFALLTLNCRNFKAINKLHGMDCGDEILITIARRLLGAVRATDSVVRLGADQFVLIVESLHNREELVRVSEKVFDAVSDSITLRSGALVNAGLNMGMALYPVDGTTVDDIVVASIREMLSEKALLLNLSREKRFLADEAPGAATEGALSDEALISLFGPMPR